jgi:acyl-CoA thioester hydrolase
MTVEWREAVREEWIDYNGHLSEPWYVLVFGHATDAVMDAVGLDERYRERAGASLFTVEAHVRYLAQVRGGEELEVRSSVVGATPKVMWIWHEMYAGGTLRATEEVLGVHVDTTTERALPFPPEVGERVRGLLVEPPEAAGGRIQVGR